MYDVEQIRALIGSILETKLLARGIQVTNLPNDLDLRDEGIVDSLGFVELLAELETRMGSQIDLSDLDAEGVTNVTELARHIARGQFSS